MEAVFAQEYPSLQAARDAINAAAKSQGTSFVIRASWPTSATATRVTLRCSKGGKYRDRRLKEARNTNTQMTECGYKITISVSASRFDEDAAALKPTAWRVTEAGSKVHNHPFTPLYTHAAYRKESLDTYRDRIIRLYNSGVRPYQIASQLCDTDNNGGNSGITKMQVYNALSRHRRDELAGRD
ncbi:hypothetical protein CDD82_1819 [Ophiocordyceps australis]|uniref:FAR1 domain-containing protein n=1 Tax=Ophiocordyceps australis TaxID=1399860 RepID=A0A2C5ZH47_9HYPO|nr:hypothetical protein CDD82_1819 [Ophiocordyceps australis]